MNKKTFHRLMCAFMTFIVLAGIFNWDIVKSIITYAEYEEYASEYNVYFRWMDDDNLAGVEEDTKIIRETPKNDPAPTGYEQAEDESRQENIFAEFTIDSPNILRGSSDGEKSECTFTISGLYDLKRGGGLKLDTSDEALSNDWLITYDEEKDEYTFKNKVDLNKDYSTTFHWYADSRDCVDGFEKELETGCKVTHKVYTTVETECYLQDGEPLVKKDTNEPLTLEEIEADGYTADADENGDPITMPYTYSKTEIYENVPIDTNNLSLKYSSRPDEFDLSITGNVLNSKTIDQLSDDYTWFDYVSKIERTQYARGLESSTYDISIQLPDDFAAKYGQDYDSIISSGDVVLLDKDDNKISGVTVEPKDDGHTYLKFRAFEKFEGYESTSEFKIGLANDVLNDIGTENLKLDQNRLHVYGYFDGQLHEQRETENPDKYAEATETIYYSEDAPASSSGRPPMPYNYGDHGYVKNRAAKISKSSPFEKDNHSRPSPNTEASKLMLANGLFGTTGRQVSFSLNAGVVCDYESNVPVVDGVAQNNKTSVAGNANVEDLHLFAEDDERNDFVYDLVVGDDALAVYRTDKTARILDDEEYDFTHITVPQLLNKTVDPTDDYPGYDYEVFVKTSSDGDDPYVKFGETKNTKTITDVYFTGKVKAFCVVVKGVAASVENFNVKADVNIKFDNEENVANIEAGNGLDIDTENRIVNYGYIQMLQTEDNNTEDYGCLKNESEQINTLKSGSTFIGLDEAEVTADDTVFARQGYHSLDNSKLLRRTYSNVWLRNAMTTVSSTTSMSEFRYVAKNVPDEGITMVVPVHKTKITSTGTILSESPGALYNFRMYAVIPDNLKLTDETLDNVTLDFSAVQQGSGESVGNEYLDASPYVYTLKLTTLNGQQVIEADFHFKAALKMDSETKVTIKYDAYIAGEDLAKLGTSERLFTASTYMMVLDSGVVVKNADNKPALVNLVVDGKQKEAALSNDQKRINLADKQRSVQSNKFITTYMHPNGAITSRVEGKNINEANSLYSYHLSFTDYINVSTAIPLIHDPILLDIVEYKPGESDEGLWQGELLGVDTTSVTAQGFEPVVYYKQVPKKDGENESAEMLRLKGIIDGFAADNQDENQISQYDAFATELENLQMGWKTMTEEPSGSHIFKRESGESLSAENVYVVAIVLKVPDSSAYTLDETINGETKTFCYMPVESIDHTITMDVVLNMQAPNINNSKEGDEFIIDEAEEAKLFVNNNQFARNDFSSIVVDRTVSGGGSFSDMRYSYVASNPTELYLSHLVRLVKVEENDNTRRLSGAKFSVYYDEGCQKPVWWWVNIGSKPTIQKMEQISDKRGYVEFSLAPGTYYLKEVAAPHGYLLDDTVYKVEVSRNDDYVALHKKDENGIYTDITSGVYNSEESGLFIENRRIENVKVRFIKRDADADDKAALNGAKYSVYKVEDSVSDTPVSFVYQTTTKDGLQGCYVYTTSASPYNQGSGGDNTPTSVLESGINNQVQGEINDNDIATVGKDGSIWLANLPDGLYVIRELSAPLGYEMSSKDFYFRVVPSRMTTPPDNSTEPDVQADKHNGLGWIMFAEGDENTISGSTGENTGDESAGSGSEGSVVVTGETEKNLYDKQKKSTLRIKKTESSSTPFGGKALSGARYTLLKLNKEFGADDVNDALSALVEKLYNGENFSAAKSGTKQYWEAVTTAAKTGRDGIAAVPNLSFGYYVFIENTAPRGYDTNITLFGAQGSGGKTYIKSVVDAENDSINNTEFEKLNDSANLKVGYKRVLDLKTGDYDVYSLCCYHIDSVTAEKYADKEPYTFYQEDMKKTGQARVEKTDDTSGLPLNKAYYQLYRQKVTDGTNPETYTETKLAAGDAASLAELKTYYDGLDGVNDANKIPVSEVLPTKTVTDDEGNITGEGVTDIVRGLDWGDNLWYFFEEKAAPLGYERNEFTTDTNVVPKRKYFQVTADNADILIKVYESDKRINGSVDLHKKKKGDTAATELAEEPMAGAKFKLVPKEEGRSVLKLVRTNENGVYDADGDYWYVPETDDSEHYYDAAGTNVDSYITEEAEIFVYDSSEPINAGFYNHLHIINIPWGVYSLVETVAPAGCSVTDDITLIVNSKNASTTQEIECEDPPAMAEITLEKYIPTESKHVFEAFGYPTFTFKVSQCDESGNIVGGGKSYVTSISFNESSNEESDYYKDSKIIKVEADKYYLIEEVKVSRYGIRDVDGLTEVHSGYTGEEVLKTAVIGDKVLFDAKVKSGSADKPVIKVTYKNEIKRYDMLSHTSSINNSFSAKPQVTGFSAEYEKTIPVDRLQRKNTLSYDDIAAVLSFNTEAESEVRLTKEILVSDSVTFGDASGDNKISAGGLKLTKVEGGLEIDYSDQELSDMFGLIDSIKVAYTYEGKTYTADMAIMFNSRTPDIKKDVIFHVDEGETHYYDFITNSGKKRTAKSFTFSISSDGGLSIEPSDDVEPEGYNYGFRLAPGVGAPPFDYWELLTGDPNAEGTKAVKDTDGNVVKFKGANQHEIVESIKAFIQNGTVPGGKTINYAAQGVNDPLDTSTDPAKGVFHFRAVPLKAPAKLADTNTLRATFKSLANNSFANIRAIQKVDAANVPDGVNPEDISVADSDDHYKKHAYAYFEKDPSGSKGVIYWYTPDNTAPLLAGNRAGLFANFNNLSDISGISDRGTYPVTVKNDENCGWITCDENYSGSESEDYYSLTDVRFMFRNTQISTFNLSSWEMKNVKRFGAMFQVKVSELHLNLSGWDVRNMGLDANNKYQSSEMLKVTLEDSGEKNNAALSESYGLNEEYENMNNTIEGNGGNGRFYVRNILGGNIGNGSPRNIPQYYDFSNWKNIPVASQITNFSNSNTAITDICVISFDMKMSGSYPKNLVRYANLDGWTNQNEGNISLVSHNQDSYQDSRLNIPANTIYVYGLTKLSQPDPDKAIFGTSP